MHALERREEGLLHDVAELASIAHQAKDDARDVPSVPRVQLVERRAIARLRARREGRIVDGKEHGCTTRHEP